MENKFKIGDKVKLNKNITTFKYGRGDVSYDEIGTVTNINFDDIEVNFPSCRFWNGTVSECEQAVFTKNDLNFADVVTLRNNERYVIADNNLYGEDDCYFLDTENLDNYNDNLTYDDDRKYDIVKVGRNGQVIYEQDIVEMTISEISEKLGYEVKIIKER